MNGEGGGVRGCKKEKDQLVLKTNKEETRGSRSESRPETVIVHVKHNHLPRLAQFMMSTYHHSSSQAERQPRFNLPIVLRFNDLRESVFS